MAPQPISSDVKLTGLNARLNFAGRRFYAWWEGYDFDEAAVRADIAARLPGQVSVTRSLSPEIAVSEAIWGEGRLEPGSPSWTMRLARLLMAPPRAKVLVLGAGAGAPLRDVKAGAKWNASGLVRADFGVAGRVRGLDLKSYDEAFQRLNKSSSQGALCLFELHRDPDPAALAKFTAEQLAPGAKAVFVDFTIARKSVRMRKCFAHPFEGSPRQAADYERAIAGAGFTIIETIDDTAAFMPLIAKGWAGWKRVYDRLKKDPDAERRAANLTALGCVANLWAERLDALRSGQLQVTRILAERRSFSG